MAQAPHHSPNERQVFIELGSGVPVVAMQADPAIGREHQSGRPVDALIRVGGTLQPGIAETKPEVPGQQGFFWIAKRSEHLEAGIFKAIEHVPEDLLDRHNPADRIKRIYKLCVLTIVLGKMGDVRRGDRAEEARDSLDRDDGVIPRVPSVRWGLHDTLIQ